MRPGRGDEGSSLALVLVVVAVMAIVSIAFLAKSGTAFRAGAALQTEVNLQYGADAGVEKGIKALQEDFDANPSTKCLGPLDDDATQLATFAWTVATKSYPVTSSCRTMQGYAASTGSSLFGAAIVTTGGDATLTTQAGSSNPLDVRGSVYTAADIDSGEIKKPIAISQGDLAVRNDCTGTPASANITVASPYAKYCTSLTPQQVANRYSLPSSPPSLLNPAPIEVNSKCRIFVPGKYTSKPAVLDANNSTTYFASGIYYLEDIGSWDINNKTQVVAGAPPAGYSGIGTDELTPCGTGDTRAKTERPTADINGTGATFILGGTSRITVKDSLVIHQRPETTGNPVPTSVYVVRSTDPGPWKAWSAGTSLSIADGSATAQMEFNGSINSYDAAVAVFASNPTTAVVRAGVVAKTLDLKASASAGALDISGYGTSATSGSRIVRITSVAKGVSGDGGQSDGVAVVEFYNDGRQPRVISWRNE